MAKPYRQVWYAGFQYRPTATVEESAPGGEFDADALSRFDEAAEADIVLGRAFHGMWIADHRTEQDYVIRVAGTVSLEVWARHEAWLAAVNKPDGT